MIQVHRFYQDIHGVKIQAGLYEVSDPQLKGKAQYLVEHEIATLIEPIAEDSIHIEADELDDVTPDELDIEFTQHAQALLDESGFSQADMLEYIQTHAIDKVSKADVQAFLDTLA